MKNLSKLEDDTKKVSTDKINLSSQILHEAEMTRQHARFNIPAKIEINGEIYELKDWSMSGCSVVDLPSKYAKQFMKAKIIFQFDSFQTSIENLSIECLNKRDNFSGCRFTNLTPQQISILNQIITAYLSGDIVTQDDIITAATKIQVYPKKKNIDEVERKKAWKILALIFITLSGLVIFLSYTAYQKLFIVNSVNGYVNTNLTVIRAPYPSFVKLRQKIKRDKSVSKNQTVAIAYLVGGGVSRLISPVDGKVFKIDIENGEFRNTGEPVLSVESNNSMPYIVSYLYSKDTSKIETGNIAKIILNGEVIYGKIIKILNSENLSSIGSKPTGNVYANPRNFIKIVIMPFCKIASKYIGFSVSIQIDTLRNKLGLIYEE